MEEMMPKSKPDLLMFDYCPYCIFYDPSVGVCNEIHENVRSNPTRFSKKCNGNLYKADENKITQKRETLKIAQEQIIGDDFSDGKSLTDKYTKHMFSGLLWAVGGTIVTIATYEAASTGGTYVVAWGAIVFGLYDFLKGFFGWLKYKE